MNSLVTIVVPVYNEEKYIQQCIESIQNQTYSNLEIILVNDGSSDRSPQICDESADSDVRIRVYHKDNGGVSDARNVGIDAATGDYLVFLDSDDHFEKDMIEVAVNSLQSNDADAAIWGFYLDYVDKDERLIRSEISTPLDGIYNQSKMKYYPLDEKSLGYLGYAWNKMYRTQLIKNNRFQFKKGISLVEDMLFNSEVLQLCNTIVFLDEPFLHYMQRPSLTLGTKFYKDYFELRLMAIAAIKKLLMAWEADKQKSDKLVLYLGFVALKSAVRMFSVEAGYTKEQKLDLIAGLLNKSEAIRILENVDVYTIKDRILKKLMRDKHTKVLLSGYKNRGLFER